MCEAPGAFVAALNHYLKSNYSESKFKWCATTLNPYYEGNSFDNAVLDDRLMSRTFDNWEFGEDFTGDITIQRNVENLVQRCRKMGKVCEAILTHARPFFIKTDLGGKEPLSPFPRRHPSLIKESKHFQISLVTADGSVDCMEFPHDQENKVHYLHFAEVVAALQILDMGGTFVLKMFTLFELTTVSLLYFLNLVFDKVDVFKPATSKQGNSEVYVICSGYQRIYKNLNYLLEMSNRRGRNDTPMFALDMIPRDFIEQVADCAKKFMLFQTEAIQSNIDHFNRPPDPDDHTGIAVLRHDIRREYVRLYRVRPISDQMKLLHGEPYTDEQNVCPPPGAFSGSFTSRLMFKKMTKDEKMLELRLRVNGVEKRVSMQNRMEPVPLSMDEDTVCGEAILKAFYGRPVRKIVSSKFVLNHCLKLLLEILDNADEEITINRHAGDNPPSAVDSIISMDYAASEHRLVMSVDIIGYKTIKIYDKFEKEFFHRLVNAINRHSPHQIRIENFLLLTHFAVGLVYALGYVYEQIRLMPNGEIHFNCLRPTGKQFLNSFLLNRIEFASTNANRSVLSVVKVNVLRHRNDFNDAVVNYNNRLTLLYCKALLDES